jgi:sec-independent protein translocase protein TatC
MEKKLNGMTIWQHLEDLRKRIFTALVGLVVGVIASGFFAEDLLRLLAEPIGGFENLLSIQVTENISVYFRVTLLSGFLIALPFILLQFYLFLSPGLRKKERQWILRSVPIATLLFIAGAVFAYLVMLPAALPFLIGFTGPEVLPKWKDYISFVTNIIFWVGLSFESPLVMFVLAKMGIVDAKGLAKQWRIAVVIIAVIAAVATPTPDPINMAILMAPLFILYGLGILLAVLASRKKDKE